MTAPRVLLIDIETSPNLAWTFDLWRTTIAPIKIVEVSRVICFSAKWLGESSKDMRFHSIHGFQHAKSKTTMEANRQVMVEAAWWLLDEADIVIHYNGHAFDLPYLNREFLHFGLGPPSPYRQIDLLQTVRKQFQFPSNQLAHVSKELGLEGKVEHEGFELWIKCLAGDNDAWKRMRKYNQRDVELLDELYDILRPWVISHPSFAAFSGTFVCPACGGENLQRRGYAYTQTGQYQRVQCMDCFKWSRHNRRETGAPILAVTQGA